MATTQKAVDILRDIRNDLALRLSTLTFVDGVDTDGNPYFSFGTGVSNTCNGVVKTKPMVWSLATDILGNTAQVYVPTVVQICTEKNPTVAGGPENFTGQQLISLLGECLRRGAIVEWYTTTFATPPTVGGITGTPDAIFKDLYYDFRKAS